MSNRRIERSCRRCGQRFKLHYQKTGRSRHVLCRDCRYTCTAQECREYLEAA